MTDNDISEERRKSRRSLDGLCEYWERKTTAQLDFEISVYEAMEDNKACGYSLVYSKSGRFGLSCCTVDEGLVFGISRRR